MTIYGVSQSTGVERRLKVEKGIEGVILTIIDHVGEKERGRISLLPDDLVSAITEAPPQGITMNGLAAPTGTATQMNVQVRRNEVWLAISSGSVELADVAVGFDDLQDALEGVISRA